MLNTNALLARVTALMLLAALAGCGGGGGGGGGGGAPPAPLVFTGNTSQAVISATNAAQLTANLVSDAEAVGAVISSATPSGSSGVREIARRLGAAFRATPLPRSGAQGSTSAPVQFTQFCDSGSSLVSGDLNESGAGTLNITWSNCRSGDFTLNGTATAQVAAFDPASEIITNGTFSSSRLTLSGPEGTTEIAGTVSILVETFANRQTTTSNIVARDARGRLTKTENLQIVDVLTFNLSSFSETISGRVFDATHGFVEISTNPSKPLTFSTLDQDFPDTGQVVLTGANGAHIRVTAVSQQIVSVELDLNGDNLYETAASLAWDDLSGLLAADLGDDDRDGMHNSWEDARGLNRASAADAAADADGDHATNLLEYLLGTHPGNSASVPTSARPRPQVTVIQLASTTDLVFDPVSQRIYASLTDGIDQVVPIDPATGTLGTPILIAEGPTRLALSDNGQYLYVGFAVDPVVRRIHLASRVVERFPFADGRFFAEDLQVLPGHPESLAVFMRSRTSDFAGVAIFENGVQRVATTIVAGDRSEVLEFSGSAQTLYSYNNLGSEFGFRRMNVDPNGSGVSVTDVTQGLITGNGVDIKFAGGRIYSSKGEVIDPATPSVVGTFALPPGALGSLVLPDPALGRVFFLVREGFLQSLYTFDLNSRLLLDVQPLPEVVGDPASSLIRWGARGLAFRASGGPNTGQVVLLQLR